MRSGVQMSLGSSMMWPSPSTTCMPAMARSSRVHLPAESASLLVGRIAVGHDPQHPTGTGGMLEEMREGDDRSLRLAYSRDELVDVFTHDVLRAVDERDHGLGRRFDALDEIGVQRERRTIETRHGDHRSVPGPRGWPSRALTDLSAWWTG